MKYKTNKKAEKKVATCFFEWGKKEAEKADTPALA